LACPGEENLRIQRFFMSVLIVTKWNASVIRSMVKQNNSEPLEITVVVCHIK